MLNPLVSIIMNCYNGEKYLSRALESIKRQKYENFELVFFDNHSNDKSEEIFKKFNDSRFKYFKSDKHKILYEARNDALKKCNGKYISFLDTDDYWFENKLFLQVPILEKNHNIGLVYGNFIKYNVNKFLFKKKSLKSNLFQSGKITKSLINNYYIGLLTVIIRKSFMSGDLEYFNPKYNLLSDFDYIIRFSQKHSFDFVKQNIAVYTQHENQLQSKYISVQAAQFDHWYKMNILNKKLSEKEYNFKNIKEKNNFLNFVAQIKEKDKLKLFKEIIFYSNNFYKIKIILLILLPEKICKKIFSLT